MAKYKFQKGEEVHFRYKNAQRQLVRGYGKVVSRQGRFYNIDVGDGLVVKIYCNQVRKNWLKEKKTFVERTFNEEIPTPENPFCLPIEEKSEETQEGKEYRLIKRLSYHGDICYSIQIKKHFWRFSWWETLKDDGILPSEVRFYSIESARKIAEELCKGRLVINQEVK